jgi:hypothetical protein
MIFTNILMIPFYKSGHGQENAHVRIEQYYWIKTQQLSISGHKGLKKFPICASNKPNSA